MRKQRGAITLITLATILLMLAFLIKKKNKGNI